MTTATLPGLIELRSPVGIGARRTTIRRIADWLSASWMDLVILGPVLGITAVVHAVGSSEWPPLQNDDEGTYMSQSWAVLTGNGPHHGLANYTYWYDHPPLGWIQLAGLTWLSHAYREGTIAVVSGRQVMLGYALASSLLVYVCARRLRCSPVWAAVGAVLFGLSPLALEYLRLVFLDCIGLPWIIAAFVLALSPLKRVWTHALSGACFAVGVLSKETYLILAPAIMWQAWQGADRRNRRMAMMLFSVVSLVVLACYPIYAMLKGELIPGKGHVSLLGSAFWQLGQRAASGSVFSPSSASHALVFSWLHRDPWMIGAAAALTPIAFLVRHLRPIALGYFIFMIMLLRHGYLPNAFVVGALPFAALIVVGVGAEMTCRLERLRARSAAGRGFGRTLRLLGWALLGGMLLFVGGMYAYRFTPAWAASDRAFMLSDPAVLSPTIQSEKWVNLHVPKNATLLVDGDMWTDFVDDGYAPRNIVWVYKLDLDPEVANRFPRGWRQMDYIVSSPVFRGDLAARAHAPEAQAAVRYSHVVAKFGLGDSAVWVLKVDPGNVDHGASTQAPSTARQQIGRF
jgi:hypothetical protein